MKKKNFFLLSILEQCSWGLFFSNFGLVWFHTHTHTNEFDGKNFFFSFTKKGHIYHVECGNPVCLFVQSIQWHTHTHTQKKTKREFFFHLNENLFDFFFTNFRWWSWWWWWWASLNYEMNKNPWWSYLTWIIMIINSK